MPPHLACDSSLKKIHISIVPQKECKGLLIFLILTVTQSFELIVCKRACAITLEIQMKKDNYKTISIKVHHFYYFVCLLVCLFLGFKTGSHHDALVDFDLIEICLPLPHEW